jgi:hypothetical protein
MGKPRDFADAAAMQAALLGLNERLTSWSLNRWKGDAVGAHQTSIYTGVEHLLDPESINNLRRVGGESRESRRVFHTLLGHYLQYRVFPYENELFTWMKGAAADVVGKKIYFKDILSWCQKDSDLQARQILEKETSSLCKFLKPFALSFWEVILELLQTEFDYEDYPAYCRDKKQIDYRAQVHRLQSLLEETDELYFTAMDAWVQESFGLPLSQLNRFDAIYLLGLHELDGYFPRHLALAHHLDFFKHWGIQVSNLPGLHLDIDYSPLKGSQAMSFALRIPHDIHLLMNPQGGWVDLETLFHEMGHALSNVYTSPRLSPADKDFFPSNALSETYAFLLQHMCLSPPFLERWLGFSSREIERITLYKTVKELSVFRRYVGKFLAEYEIFRENDLANGDIYASLMKRCTGFSYLPETQLFDLAPEFYALDYVFSWMAEAAMEKRLRRTLGDEWMFKEETGTILKDWWWQGNRYELEEFFHVNEIGTVTTADILERWLEKIPTSGGAPHQGARSPSPDDPSRS